ncbi:MAG: hypothetical protein ACI9SJ_001066 [Flavobacteriaceae bacterium]|jgi:hypothetical protein|uniref:DUF6268 family outer membrane beta-barrel protein n=1 Tax=Candidatus Marifrigoribacter sp. Uisw_064 TaxID=3230970 RepID=UPI003AE29828
MNTFHLKTIPLLFLLIPISIFSQDYVDILKVGYGTTFNSTFEDSPHSTDVNNFEIGLTYPVVLNEKNALITGADFNLTSLQLAPVSEYTNLYSTTFKIGLSSTFNEKWSGTFVLLPKIASDYHSISSDDFYFGGFASLKYKKNKHLTYRFGFYSSSEAFGVFATPIFGVYYKSSNQRLVIDASLPITANINYNLGAATIGFDYLGIGRSYLIHQENTLPVYVEQSPLEFSSYFQLNTFNKNVLVRAKLGYTTNEHEVYAENDKLDFRLSAFSFGNDRRQLNSSLNGSLFIKFEAIYRFHIKKKESNN